MRLIDAEKLKYHYSWWGQINPIKELFDAIIDQQPTVDAEIVKHGYIIVHNGFEDDYYEMCSICGSKDVCLGNKYCPNCGTKLDLNNE